jgi:hypothetical protein
METRIQPLKHSNNNLYEKHGNTSPLDWNDIENKLSFLESSINQEKNKKNDCGICGKVYKLPYRLRIHLRTHV